MRIRYAETALAEIREIFAYVHERNPSVAAKIVLAIERIAERLSEYPQSARVTDEADVRMVPLGRYPYLIFYRVADDELQIIRVLHGARARP